MAHRQEDDDDDISLTSTVSSEPKSEYDVEEVLAEGQFEDGVRYLVQWAGYPPERNSWEPAQAFTNGQTMVDWRRKKKAIAEGKCKKFDVEAWQQYMAELEEKRIERKRRRDAKRRRLSRLADHGRRRASAGVDHSLRRSSPRLRYSAQGVQAQQRVAQDLPPVLFGGGKPSQAHPQRRSSLHSNTTGKWFPNLSSKWWHEKARNRELDPDINRLDLRRPSEWPANPPIAHRTSGSSNVTPPPEQTPDIQSAPSGPSRTRSPEKVDETMTEVNQPAEQRKERESEYYPVKNPRGGRNIMTAFGARFVRSGELLIRILYGPDREIIGTAKLCGLDTWTRSQVLKHKIGHNLDIWFQHVYTLDQYQTLASNAMNAARDVGWIEGYDDSSPEIRQMSQELKRENTVAIFHSEKSSLAFFAYPPDSLDFRFLSNVRKDIPETYLHVHVREFLGSIEQLQHNAYAQELIPRHIKTDTVKETQKVNKFDHTHKVNKVDEFQHSELFEDARSSVSISLDTADQSVENTLERHMSPIRPSEETIVEKPRRPSLPDDVRTHPSFPTADTSEAMEIDHQGLPPASEEVSSTGGPFDLKAFFRTQFGVNFETLVRVNAGINKTQMAQALYLMFPEDPEHVKEFQLLNEFLKEYKPVVYSSQHEDDWEKFARTVSSGVVFFHESFASFHALPFLKTLLGKPGVGFWSVSLSKPLQFTDQPSCFQRIFPHGCVILLTEGFMLHEPDATMIILAWMSDWVKKKLPGNWKIMFRPDVLNWALQQSETSPERKTGIWLTIYRLILQLCVPPAYDTPSGHVLPGSTDEFFESNVISPPDLPGYGLRTQQESPDLPVGSSREVLDTDHLIEFFAGWALVNSHLYRKFMVVTSQKESRWEQWEHIELKAGAKDTLATLKIDHRHYWHKLVEKRNSDGEGRVQATPFTPRTPGGHRSGSTASALVEHNASKVAQNSASAQFNYPEPYH
ncbi:putative Chromo domain protein Chp1p [Aspergillus homomorphus CBS 101889]|uniref:Chromo domain-containing protein n=1 Tax=Aspergillus homomorphus (strain CBS 101889) TaxID=1450537 RepID=A0A395I0J4_ASPHC|nr:hypothetical protein BO97DRAFT_478161 [Aspergillus homomorphus CBS 101889]RAL12054.1 hypothetical protein BO97DRAFT_478161 [Aspergillus homomorphus CBS 101889]